MSNPFMAATAGLLIVCIGLGGCGAGVPEGPETAVVTGRVTLDGEPVAGANLG